MLLQQRPNIFRVKVEIELAPALAWLPGGWRLKQKEIGLRLDVGCAQFFVGGPDQFEGIRVLLGWILSHQVKVSALDLAKSLVKELGLKLTKKQTRTIANRIRYHALKRGIDRAMEIMSKARPPKSQKERLKKSSAKPVVESENKAYKEWLRVNPKSKRL